MASMVAQNGDNFQRLDTQNSDNSWHCWRL